MGRLLTFKELLPQAKMAFQMPSTLTTSALHPVLAAGQDTSWALSFDLWTTLGAEMAVPVFTDEGLNLRKGGIG